MSGHDRGTFGELLSEVRTHGIQYVTFTVDLESEPEDEQRWLITADRGTSHGRTGEEALRRLVESLR